MEKVGVLVVSYGARAAAMIDAFARTQDYRVEIYVADKQRNPFNLRRAREHVVIPDLNIERICKFAKRHKHKIDFGIVGPEKPIIEGIRDVVEKETDIPLICPTKEYAIEASKVAQRFLFQKVVPEVNPKFRVFDPKDYSTITAVKREVNKWLDEIGNEVAVKPDRPAAGKGVGVWGDHFNTREELVEHFMSNIEYGPVIIEEKIEGEESSFQAFCDGKRLAPLPETRDYKRAFDGDKGPNTGGMGSYKDVGDTLPFMTTVDKEKEIEVVNRIFKELRKRATDTDLRGIPFYDAFIHTSTGPKVLENNSRPGDPEIQNLLPILKDDFVDVCYKMLEGNLTGVNIERKATVVTYKVPPNYGGFANTFPERVKKDELNKPVNLSQAEKLAEKYENAIRIYPASMELREDGNFYALKSRAVCVVGVGNNISEAREISLEGIMAITGGALWNRTDIASTEHIRKSIEHMRRLRQSKR
ncbi:MAG: phosphoribosylamine--glycine ligase [Candidatus Bathyarchaeia archaeon]